MNSNSLGNSLAAIFWFSLSAVVAVFSVYIIFTPGKFLVVSFLGLAVILALVGCQRTTNYRIEQTKFNKMIFVLGLFVAISCTATIIFNRAL